MQAMECNMSEPVCGTDGGTYRNICEFNVAKLVDPDLQILYEGPCEFIWQN